MREHIYHLANLGRSEGQYACLQADFDDSVVDQSGYLPVAAQVENFIATGKNIASLRAGQSSYHFPDGKDNESVRLGLVNQLYQADPADVAQDMIHMSKKVEEFKSKLSQNVVIESNNDSINDSNNESKN